MAHILIAEDDPAVCAFAARALEGQGHHVVTAPDGGAALEVLDSQSFDLLLTDIMMPVMDGIALALKAADRWPDLTIVMMTGYSAQKERAHNLDDLIHEVILKPFTLDSLRACVEGALAAGRT